MNSLARRLLLTVACALGLNLVLAQTMPRTDLPPELDKWMTAIVQTESGNKPWAILNNTYFRQGKSGTGGFFPTRQAAEEYAGRHIASSAVRSDARLLLACKARKTTSTKWVVEMAQSCANGALLG